MDAKGEIAKPRVAGLRVLWYGLAFGGLIAGFLLALALTLRHHTESQRHTCHAILAQIEMMLQQQGQDHSLPAELSELSKGGRPLLDPWGHPFVYRVGSSLKYQLYSIGPNGVDENGKGDDISNED